MKVKVLLKYMGRWRWHRGLIVNSNGIYRLRIFKRGWPFRRVLDEIELPYNLDDILFQGRSRFIIVDLDHPEKARLATWHDVKLRMPDEETIKFVGKMKARIYAAMYEEQVWKRAQKFILIVSVVFGITVIGLLIWQYYYTQGIIDFFRSLIPPLPPPPAGG